MAKPLTNGKHPINPNQCEHHLRSAPPGMGNKGGENTQDLESDESQIDDLHDRMGFETPAEMECVASPFFD